MRGIGYTGIWEFPKIGGTILGVPIIRTLVFWGLYWGSPILGKYHIGGGLRVYGCHAVGSRLVWAHPKQNGDPMEKKESSKQTGGLGDLMAPIGTSTQRAQYPLIKVYTLKGTRAHNMMNAIFLT